MNKPRLALVFALFLTSLAFGKTYIEVINEGANLHKAKEYAKAVSKFEEAFKMETPEAWALFKGARSAACAGNTELAFDWLQKAADQGLSLMNVLQESPEIESLRTLPRWQPIVDKVRKNWEAAESKIDKPLRAELLAIKETDQKYRLQIQEIEKKFGHDSPQMVDLRKTIQQKDAENSARVTAIIDTRGWLGPDTIGDAANICLFLVIQHSDLATQQKYLPLLRAAVKEKKARRADLALMEDRVALREGHRQIYGSQFRTDPKTGKSYVRPLDDPDHVDERRLKMGLDPMAENVRKWGITWDVEEYKKQLPLLE